MEESIGILIARSKDLVSELLVAAFSRNPRFRVIAHATTEEEIMATLERETVNVALIGAGSVDASTNDSALLCRLREAVPSVKLVMLFEKREPKHVVEWFRYGARGVFSIDGSEFEMLCKCVDRVHQGQIWASTEELGWVMAALEGAFVQPAPLCVVNAKGINLLSKREEDVVRLLMEGLSNRDIAQALNLSQHTIKNYLFRIFDKLGVSSRTELLLYAFNSMKKTPSVPDRFDSLSAIAS